MQYESEKNLIRKKLFRRFKSDDCNVSKASIELMLNRIFDGNKLDFPFTK